MILDTMQHIPLSSAYLCQDCDCVGNCSMQCPACASGVLMGLAGVLERKEEQDVVKEFAPDPCTEGLEGYRGWTRYIFTVGQGIETPQEMMPMAMPETTIGKIPVDETLVVDKRPTYIPVKPEKTDAEAEKKVDEVANKAAHKAAETEQEFDTTNSNLFTK